MNDYIKAAKIGKPVEMDDDYKPGFMWEHRYNEHHNDIEPVDPENDYKFSLVDRMEDALTRQLTEAVFIKKAVGDGKFVNGLERSHKIKTMNRKHEYFAPRERYRK